MNAGTVEPLEPTLDSGAELLLHRHMKDAPDLSPRKQAERAARDERLARALRDNLQRRKGQARAQAERAVAKTDAGEP